MGKISDIAQKANVSKSTVSNALSGRRYVSADLKKRVFDVAKELNYGKTYDEKQFTNTEKVIGLSLNKEEYTYNEFEQEVIKGMLTVCNKHNYSLLIKNRRAQNVKQQYPTDGEVILNPNIEDNYKGQFPYVWIGTPPLKERHQIPYVDNDNEMIGYMITTYLIEKGHRKICFFNSPSDKTVSVSRKVGYQQALTEYNLMQEKSLHYHFGQGNSSYEDVYEKTIELLSNDSSIDAIIVDSDVLAKAIYEACKTLNISIPVHLSVIAIYTDEKYSEQLTPGLSRVNLNPYLLGVEATRLLLSMTGYEKTTGGGAMVPVNIIEKKSVKNRKG